MASLWTRASILLRDNAGNICKCIVMVAASQIDPSGTAVAAIRGAIAAISNALSPRAETGTQKGNSSGTLGTGDYDTIEDRAILTFVASDGSTTLVEIPSPTNGTFAANGYTVDPAGDAADLISFYQSNAKSKYNLALTFVKGERFRKHLMKV